MIGRKTFKLVLGFVSELKTYSLVYILLQVYTVLQNYIICQTR